MKAKEKIIKECAESAYFMIPDNLKAKMQPLRELYILAVKGSIEDAINRIDKLI